MKPREDQVGIVDSTAALALLTGRPNYQVIVRDTGLFEWVPTGTPNGVDVFAGSIGYWSKVFSGGASIPTLDAPVLTLISVGSTSIQADWTQPADAVNFQLYLATLSDFSDETIIYNGALLTFIATGLNPSTLYYSRVRARGYEKMNSEFATDSVTTDEFIPDIISANKIAEFAIDEGSGQKIFNKVVGNTADTNLIHAPEKAWTAISNFIPSIYVASETTRTDNYVANSDGNVQMHRIVTLSGSTVNGGTGAFAGLRIQGETFPAGQYTLSLEVKSNTGSSQNMRMAYTNSGSISGDLVVPTTHTRVSFTFTHGGGAQLIYVAINGSAGTPLDISIDKIKLEAGAVATAYVTPDFDMGFGITGVSNASDPTWVAGKGVNFASGTQYAFAIAKNAPTVTNFSGYVVAKVSSAVSGQNIIFSSVFGDGGFEFYAGEGGTSTPQSLIPPRIKYRNNTATVKLTKVADDQYHVLAFTYNGTSLKYYIDGIEQATLSASLTSVQLSKLLLNYSPLVGGLGGASEINYALLYSDGHSASDVALNYTALKAIMNARGISMATNDIAIAVEGDSITIDINTYARKAIRANMVPLIAENFATVGATMAVLESRKATVKAWLNASTATTKVLSVFIGANDLVGASVPATVLAALKSYCLDMRASVSGLQIAVCSVLPNTSSGQIANRNVYNPLLVADTSFYDVLVPFHLNSNMGNDADASNATKYSDGVHPTNAGHDFLYPDWKTAIETLL